MKKDADIRLAAVSLSAWIRGNRDICPVLWIRSGRKILHCYVDQQVPRGSLIPTMWDGWPVRTHSVEPEYCGSGHDLIIIDEDVV